MTASLTPNRSRSRAQARAEQLHRGREPVAPPPRRRPSRRTPDRHRRRPVRPPTVAGARPAPRRRPRPPTRPSPVTTTTGVSASSPHRRSARRSRRRRRYRPRARPPVRRPASGRRRAELPFQRHQRRPARRAPPGRPAAPAPEQPGHRPRERRAGTAETDRAPDWATRRPRWRRAEPPAVALGQVSPARQRSAARSATAPSTAGRGRPSTRSRTSASTAGAAVPGGDGRRPPRPGCAGGVSTPISPSPPASWRVARSVMVANECATGTRSSGRPASRAGLDQVVRDLAELGLAGRQRRHAGADQRGDEPARAARLVGPPPGEPGEHQLPAGQVAPRVEQVGGDHRPHRRDRRAAHRPGPAPPPARFHQFPQVHAALLALGCWRILQRPGYGRRRSSYAVAVGRHPAARLY